MPASDFQQFLGTIFAHSHGRPAKMVGTLHVDVHGGEVTYTATHRSHQESTHPDEETAILSCVGDDAGYWSYTLERTFMHDTAAAKARPIVTTKPV